MTRRALAYFWLIVATLSCNASQRDPCSISIDNSKNAASTYEKAWSMLGASLLPFFDANSDPVGRVLHANWDEGQYGLLGKYLDARAEGIEIFKRATLLPHCRFEKWSDRSDPYEQASIGTLFLLMPDLLRIEGHRFEYSSSLTKAAANYLSIIRHAAHLKQLGRGYTFASGQQRFNVALLEMNQMISANIERALPEIPEDEIGRVLGDSQWLICALEWDLIELLRGFENDFQVFKVDNVKERLSGIRSNWEAFINLVRDRPTDWFLVSSLTLPAQDEIKVPGSESMNARLRHSLSARSKTMAHVQYDGMRILLALHRFRKDRGYFPRALEELRPEYLESIPTDLFTGKAFRYEVKDGRVSKLLSLGDNLMEDDPNYPEASDDILIYSVRSDP